MILTKYKIDSIDLEQIIDDKIKTRCLNEILIIVPTNRKSRYLKKEIIAYSPGGAAGKINLETIGTFATNLFFCNSSNGSAVLTKLRILSDAASSILLKQSLQECSLKYFGGKKEIPSGTLQRIKNVISEYKKNGITPVKLKLEAVSLTETERLKAEDIADVYEKYDAKCKELKVREIGDIYSELIQITSEDFNNKFRRLYPDVNLIIINGFDEFTLPEIDIIDYTANVKDSKLFLYFDYYNYNPLIFSHLDKCYKYFTNKGFIPIIDRSQSELRKFQIEAREKLFRKKPSQLNASFNHLIFEITGKNREKEVEFIAKEIKDLITEKRIEPHHICVVFNLIHKYSPIIRDVFSNYGLPYNLTDRFSLNTSSAVISIINYLEILENDFYYKNIFRALSSGYLRSSNINLSNLLQASVDLKIISGFKNWTDSLKNEINKPEEFELEESFSFNKKEIYKKALVDILKLERQLAPFSRKMTLTEFNKNFRDLVFTLGIHKKLINNDDSGFIKGNESIEKNIKAATVFIDTVHEILSLLELEYGDKAKFNLKFFLNNIRTAVSSIRYNIKEKSNYGIQVTTLNEIRGLKFDYLFIGGLCDGDLPTRYTPEIFFSGSFVKNEIKHQTEERYHFYQSLCSWEKGLYLSRPFQDDRQELAESNFLKEFRKLFALNTRNESDFSKGIYSKEELLSYIGKTVLNEDFDKSIKAENVNDYSINLESIKNSVIVDQIRLNEPFGDSQYTGKINHELSSEAREKLCSYKDREYSISQLETYAKCPYKYFAERVLKLKPIEEPTEEIEALEMGSLLHNILYEFYKAIREKGIIISNASADDFRRAQDILFRIAEEKIDAGNFNSPLTFYEKEKILGINGKRENSLLYLFLKTEKENNENFIPEFFEVVFGNLPGSRYSGRGHDIKLKELKAGDVKIRGKIDRIDINESEKTYEIVDYKLGGKKPKRDELDEGISLQLPLYMYAAKELINAQLNKDLYPDDPKIYSLKYKEGQFGKFSVNIGLKKKNTNDERREIIDNLINECLNSVEKFVKEISEGKFNLTTLKDRENKVCRFCSFKPICRIQEVN